MKLNFTVDTFPNSISIRNTPGPSSQRLPFYTTAAGHFISGQEYFTEREGLENSHLLFYTISGCGRLAYRDREWDLVPGSAAIINCFEYQYYATASEAPWDFKWIHIAGNAAAEYENRINTGSLAVMQLGESCKTSQALDDILRYLQDKSDHLADIKISHAIMEILTELSVIRLRPGHFDILHKQDMERVLQYIHTHYAKITGIDEIIGCTHISKFYFIRLFKANTGQSLYEFLNNYRVDVAKRLLQETGCKVCSASRDVGFKDVNCFIRYFKKVTGVTPAVYQKFYLY